VNFDLGPTAAAVNRPLQNILDEDLFTQKHFEIFFELVKMHMSFTGTEFPLSYAMTGSLFSKVGGSMHMHFFVFSNALMFIACFF
jgi:hypothetical protein